MVESDLQQDHLHYNHDDGLDQQGIVEVRLGPVEEPGRGEVSQVPGMLVVGCRNYFKMDATSMMSGMSRENPALDLFLCIDNAWSP